MKAGDIVKLTARAAKGLQSRKMNRIDWMSRRGTVKKVQSGGTIVRVIWDGTKSSEVVPARAIELAGDPA